MDDVTDFQHVVRRSLEMLLKLWDRHSRSAYIVTATNTALYIHIWLDTKSLSVWIDRLDWLSVRSTRELSTRRCFIVRYVVWYIVNICVCQMSIHTLTYLLTYLLHIITKYDVFSKKCFHFFQIIWQLPLYIAWHWDMASEERKTFLAIRYSVKYCPTWVVLKSRRYVDTWVAKPNIRID